MACTGLQVREDESALAPLARPRERFRLQGAGETGASSPEAAKTVGILLCIICLAKFLPLPSLLRFQILRLPSIGLIIHKLMEEKCLWGLVLVQGYAWD